MQYLKIFILHIRWIWDYYILYAIYSPYLVWRYHMYMLDVWGDKYRKLMPKRGNKRW